jgi:hypothetical protein
VEAQQRNCLNCNELFIPGARNRHHQKYCTKPQCRKASKREAQQRWLDSDKGAGYFSDEYNKGRVREWRKAHPGYWKRKKARSTEPPVALQDLLNSQVIENTEGSENSRNHALQDLCFMQPALIIGLISTLTGSTLQDDIVTTSRRLIDSGRDILGKTIPTATTS